MPHLVDIVGRHQSEVFGLVEYNLEPRMRKSRVPGEDLEITLRALYSRKDKSSFVV